MAYPEAWSATPSETEQNTTLATPQVTRHRTLGSSNRLQDHQKAAGIVVQDMASVLFGVEGLQVIDAEAGLDGTREVWAVTDHLAAGACPDCVTVSASRLSRPAAPETWVYAVH